MMTGCDAKGILCGGCTCDKPNECRFSLSQFVKDKIDINADFADVEPYFEYLRGE